MPSASIPLRPSFVCGLSTLRRAPAPIYARDDQGGGRQLPADNFCILPRALQRCRKSRTSLGRKSIRRGRCAQSLALPLAGGTDITARLIGQWLSERLGHQFFIENRPGGGVDPTTLEPEEVPKFKMLSSQRARCTTLMARPTASGSRSFISQCDVRNSRAAFGTDPMSPNKPWDPDTDPVTKN
jgi:hypothetical protein